MTVPPKPTHTHRERGGRFAMIAHYNGDTSLEAQQIVVYRDLDFETDTATTSKDWEDNWRPIARDDCPVCMGSGHDHIKGNKARPCGGCYGLGKVRQDGETPQEMWELAEVAEGIIKRLHEEAAHAQAKLAHLEGIPGIREAREAYQRQLQDVVAEQEQKWRNGRGHGPGGRRHTGD